MREYFDLEEMAHPEDARAWFEAFWTRYPFTPEAVAYFRTLRLELGTAKDGQGGGYWFGDRGLVLLRGAQDEAAIHELGHAWHHPRREGMRAALMATLRDLGRRCPPGFPIIADLARVYCEGIPTQPDPTSPTGSWRGMLAEDNDWETFAGFLSGVRGDASLLPPELRHFYEGLLNSA